MIKFHEIFQIFIITIFIFIFTQHQSRIAHSNHIFTIVGFMILIASLFSIIYNIYKRISLLITSNIPYINSLNNLPVVNKMHLYYDGKNLDITSNNSSIHIFISYKFEAIEVIDIYKRSRKHNLVKNEEKFKVIRFESQVYNNEKLLFERDTEYYEIAYFAKQDENIISNIDNFAKLALNDIICQIQQNIV